MAPGDDRLRDESGYPLPWPAYTAQDYARHSAGEFASVAFAQPPPADMPPLPLMVLDALADDVETIYTMRLCGDMVPNGLAVVGEAHILDALRSLLAGGLVGVWREYVVVGDRVIERSPVGDLGTTDDDLRRCWFEMTQAGRERWKAAASDLEAYWDTHPLEPRDDADVCGLDDGFSTPEEAARGDIPARFCTVLGVRFEGNEARVWMLTNDRPMFEPYEVVCVRRRGRWFGEDGFGGMSLDAPDEVLDAARRLGW